MAPNRSSQLQKNKRTSNRDITALIADDSSISRRHLAGLLEKHGCRVVAQCSNATEAVAQCKEYRPDIAFLDISMPPNNDISHIYQILDDGTAGRVVINSVLVATRPDAFNSLRQRSVLLLAKPVDERALLKILTEISAT